MAQAYIQAISARRNALLPVNLLPSEILGSIFSQLLPVIKVENQHDPAYDDTANEIASATRSIIAASHVCQCWRAVSVGVSALWAVLWMGNGPWMREMIRRSNDAPLTIIQDSRWAHHPFRVSRGFIENPRSVHVDYLESISAELFRSKQPKYLCVEAPQTGGTSNFEEFITRAAPRLETLVLHAMISDGDRGAMSIPRDLLGRCAPALTTLVIRGSFTHEALWTSPVLSGLTSLTLYTQPSATVMMVLGSQKEVSLCDVLDALRNMHKLETLSIEFPCLSANIAQPLYFSQSGVVDGARVHLPRLSTLRLMGNETDAARLTNHLTIPPTCSMRYRVDAHKDRPAHWPSMMSAVVSPAEPLGPIGTVELLLFSTASHLLQIRCWNHDADEQIRLALQLRLIPQPGQQIISTTPAEFMQAFDAITASLDLSRLHQLRWAYSWLDFVGPPVQLGIDDYRQVLGRFEMVESLHFDTLIGHQHELDAVAIDRTILPRLKKICFVDKRQIYDDPAWQSASPFDSEGDLNVEEEVQALVEVLLRVAQARDLETLEFRGYKLSEVQVNPFVGVVRHIIMT